MFPSRSPGTPPARLRLSGKWTTLLDHALDEAADDVNAGPVAPVHDDIPPALVGSELLSEVVDEVALASC